MTEQEEIFQCPYCGEMISMVIDQFNGAQEYIEDCEVCCRPIQLKYKVENYEISQLEIRRLDD